MPDLPRSSHGPHSLRGSLPLWPELKQVDLGLSILEMPDFANYMCWIRHNRGTVDGEPVYAMESLTFPGWYWSIEGTIVNWNTIKLIEHDEPADAQGFIFR